MQVLCSASLLYILHLVTLLNITTFLRMVDTETLDQSTSRPECPVMDRTTGGQVIMRFRRNKMCIISIVYYATKLLLNCTLGHAPAAT